MRIKALAFVLAAALSFSAQAADLTFEPGTNGLVVSPLSLFGATDLSGLTNGSCVTSTLSAFSQSSTQFSSLSPGGAIEADVDFQPAGAFTPANYGVIGIWLSRSGDGGSTFESTLATCSTTQGPFNRPPDFVIPLVGVAVSSSSHIASTIGTIWPGSYKAVFWNNSGTAFSANNHVVKLRAWMRIQH